MKKIKEAEFEILPRLTSRPSASKIIERPFDN
jgi:hypothetical protein